MSVPLLSIDHLSISIGEKQVVSDVSLVLSTGEILALVGESGSGKTLTALSIPGLLPKVAKVTSGNISMSIDGQHTTNLLQLNDAGLRNMRGNDVATIFQEPMTSLNPVFTCGQQVSEALRAHASMTKEEARQRTIKLFGEVLLPDPPGIYKRYPHELSGGQKQRVMIAMAMSCSPSILIADEPTTALDVTVQKTILELLKTLQQQHRMGILFITHDLGVVAQIADRVAVMYQGHIVETGTVREIFEHNRHPYTKALLSCRPAGHPKGQRLPMVSDFLDPQKPQAAKVASLQSPGTDTLITVQHLAVSYPTAKNLFGSVKASFNAVDDVSFEIHRGETLGLVGESGCGKTTLGRALLRLVTPDKGTIIYNQQDLLGLNGKLMRNLRQELQIVFQDPFSSLNPRMTVGDAIMEPLSIHSKMTAKERKLKMNSLLEQVHLSADQAARYPHEFSGGQRQRIGIARALAVQPSFIVFDESVSALDVSVQAQVLNLINELKVLYNFTALFISHDLSVVRYLCDRVMVMRKGKIVESGDTETVYRQPLSDYTKLLLDSIPQV